MSTSEIFTPEPALVAKAAQFAGLLHHLCIQKIAEGLDPNLVLNAVGQVLAMLCLDFEVSSEKMAAALPIWYADMQRVNNEEQADEKQACN